MELCHYLLHAPCQARKPGRVVPQPHSPTGSKLSKAASTAALLTPLGLQERERKSVGPCMAHQLPSNNGMPPRTKAITTLWLLEKQERGVGKPEVWVAHEDAANLEQGSSVAPIFKEVPMMSQVRVLTCMLHPCNTPTGRSKSQCAEGWAATLRAQRHRSSRPANCASTLHSD